MRKLKILVPLFALMFIAAACNKQAKPAVESNNQGSEQPSVQTITIAMTAAGFEPAAVTVNKGDTVKFVNSDTKLHLSASAPHPTHTDYPAFDPKTGIAVGSSWSFTFDQAGAWKFHDHLAPGFFGSVTVR